MVTTSPPGSGRLELTGAFYDMLYSHERREALNQTELVHALIWKKIVNQEVWPAERIVDAAIAKEARSAARRFERRSSASSTRDCLNSTPVD